MKDSPYVGLALLLFFLCNMLVAFKIEWDCRNVSC